MFDIVAAVVIVAVAGFGYAERKSLKADVVSAEAKVKTLAETFTTNIQARESQVRAKIAVDVAKVVSAAKGDAIKAEAEVKADVSKVEGVITGAIAKVEADLKKVI